MLKEQNETNTESKTYNILNHNIQDNKTMILFYTIILVPVLHYGCVFFVYF